MQRLDEKFGAVLIPLVTPFDDEGAINYKALTALVEYLIGHDYLDSLVVCGTTGEFYALSFAERVEILRVIKETVGNRVPLIAGTGSAYTIETIKLTQEAERLGYDCAMVVAPYYQKATQEGLYQHFKAVAASTSLPIMLYNIPLFTGVNLEPETVGRLCAIQNIMALKEEAGLNPTQMTHYRFVMPKDRVIYCGDDTMVLQTLPQGSSGVVSGGSHIVGDLMKKMIAAYRRGDVTGASELYFKLMPFFKALNQNGRINPIPILKAAITIATGIDVGPTRLPNMPATDEEKEVVASILRRLGRL